MNNAVVIVGATRTPIGKFQGALASLSAPVLGSMVIKGLLDQTKLNPSEVQEVILGHVLTAGVGQAPARQAAIKAGLPHNVSCLSVNKVCGSGIKAVMLGADAIRLGAADVVIAGGMESMSNAPYLLSKARGGFRLGHGEVTDSLIKDGLWDVYNDVHMGNCAERCAEKYGFSREDQDEFAIESYKRALKAAENGWTKEEITPVEISTRKGSVIVDADEGLVGVDFEKMRTLRTVFKPDGTITAANASSLNDGACALLLMRAEKAQSLGLAPLATISDYGTVGTAPEWFTTAPDAGIKALLKKSDTLLDDIDLFEVNEAFAVVNLFAEKEGKLPRSKVNIHGGAIALGHPIGASGARILTTLIYALRQHKKTLGLASICIGGGEAASMIIKAL